MANGEFLVTQELQTKLLSLLWEDRDFSKRVSPAIKPELFSTRFLQWFFTTITSRDHTAVTLKEALMEDMLDGKFSEDAIPVLARLMEQILTPPLPVEREIIREKLDSFIKTQSVKLAFEKSLEYAKNQQWDELVEEMSEAVKAGCNLTDLGYDYLAELSNRVTDRTLEEAEDRITTGIPDLDVITTGGISKGQLALILGGTGRGKSVFLSWLGRAAVLTGKRVLYVTLELSQKHIAARYDSLFAQVEISHLKDHAEEVLRKISPVATSFKSYGRMLTIKHWPADGATVPTLAAFLQQLSANGMMPDMVIIDYLDLLASHRRYNSEHMETNAITKALVGMAAEYNVAIYTASQLNRSGMSAETPEESSMAGYIGKQYHADMVWAIGQTNEERTKKKLRIVVLKNRNGEAGRVIPLSTNYSKMTFYAPEEDCLYEEDEEELELEDSGYTTGQRPDLEVLMNSVFDKED